MFDLNSEVKEWTEEIYGINCGSTAEIEELQDHLYCEIERLQSKGLNEKEAFYKAAEKMGSVDALKAEYHKNKSFLAKVYAFEQTHLISVERPDWSSRKTNTVIIMHSLLFALAMVLAPLILPDIDDAILLTYAVILPLWFATFMLLPNLRHAMACERRLIKKLVGRTK